ncbi:WD40-repeat-containing domain protein [Lasiosphaeris hirsuta]|uniref:WD40-repeat-containing domain protein n=1 Tax=Lasiosphaeris hirsuta TaxID=260670 RepID=A0AA40BCL8_9PEZI|nr:WD40-repeat-containing domain protein [Lasiosphaeris hirsuta]
MFLRLMSVLLLFAVHGCCALDFTIAGGQIFTPGLVILDAPQPGTPLGGDLIEVALDVSTNGRMPLPPYAQDSPSQIHNITIFLYSYDTGKNFTITNGTASSNNASLGDIMFQEPGSTVKHVKWTWPDCLVGDGQPVEVDSPRGVYNVCSTHPFTRLLKTQLTRPQISIRQNFRLNGQDHYTIFDLPILITNRIDQDFSRPSCDALNNPLLTPEQINATAANNIPILFAPGDATIVQSTAGAATSGDDIMAARQQNDESSDESFGGFGSFDGENDAMSMSGDDDGQTQTRIEPTTTLFDDEKDSDEEELERFVLGNRANFRERLFRDDLLVTDSTALVKASGDAANTANQDDLDDAALFFIDTGKDADAAEKERAQLPTDPEEAEAAPAWEDSDDERLMVSLAGATRLRKLRTTEAEDTVSGTEYARRLRQQYLRLYPLPEWARDAAASGKKSKGRRRRSSASQGGDGSSDASSGDSDDEMFDDALPLEAFLRDANSFSGAGARKRRKLRPETIDIQKTRDIPDVHKAAVSSLSFHPKHPILLSSSVASIMYLHQFDPTAHPTPHPSLASVQVKSTDLRRTAFLGPDGDEVFFAGRRRYLHSWNLSTGLVRKVTKIQGHQKEQRTMERFRLSPCGRYMALVSSERKGGGMLNILSVATMQWLAQARFNGRGGVADFAWWNTGDGLSALGMDGQVTEWSMLTRRAVGVWRDEGSIGGTAISLGGRNGPEAIGGDRWVAIGSKAGILNVYERKNLIADPSPATEDAGSEVPGPDINPQPTPTRAFEHLTTSISIATFSPDGQLLAFGSRLKKDTLRLVHLPSCTVYRNWPTDQTALGRITSVAFSATSEILAVGNDVGKVRMWEIRS